MIRQLLIALFVFNAVLIPPLAQDDNGCDLDFLTANFLHHLNEPAPSQYLDILRWERRLETFFEYMTFLIICREVEQPCDRLGETYADAIAGAETRAELAVISANLMTDVIMCAESDPLITVFDEIGFECAIPYADETYVDAECAGENSLTAAQELYDAALEQRELEFFTVTLTDSDSTTRYIYTGDEWLVEPQVPDS